MDGAWPDNCGMMWMPGFGLEEYDEYCRQGGGVEEYYFSQPADYCNGYLEGEEWQHTAPAAPGTWLLPGQERIDGPPMHGCRHEEAHEAWEETSALAPAARRHHERDVKNILAGPARDERTTVMLRNLPNNYTRTMLGDLLDMQGFACRYDFIYLPIDFKTHAGLGYAFVNATTPANALELWQRLEGFAMWAVPSEKVCTVGWSSPHQGLVNHLERYQNSPVMHDSVPDAWKPIVLVEGRRVNFPPPTKKVKAPRINGPA